MSLSENIRNARIKRGLTQKQLAEKIGVTEAAISNYEAGTREPDIEKLKKLSKILGVSINKLCK